MVQIIAIQKQGAPPSFGIRYRRDMRAQAKLTRGALQGERMPLSSMKEGKLSNNQRVNVLHRK
ncbi:hypothetical protein CWM57_02415 [Klebsiella sp. G-Nf4]|nr:hypothetical protein CWM64_04240 [Klebsiella sp. I-Nf8]PJR66819.1 hypothetical protein CWM61_00815 [Klebsiella sp. K-Nf6]PJX71735.1 hypothetical protein CWM57_02415 [Klebsiella sp. G-Nf4]PJX74599.1 hypothetical protein CWM55_14010 [Klebsiella sp. G2-16S-Nf13]PKJ77005.1 hypothetical protein CWM65_05350 [Klebsiella sp. J-Nf11]